jgi:hypothetical protein
MNANVVSQIKRRIPAHKRLHLSLKNCPDLCMDESVVMLRLGRLSPHFCHGCANRYLPTFAKPVPFVDASTNTPKMAAKRPPGLIVSVGVVCKPQLAKLVNLTDERASLRTERIGMCRGHLSIPAHPQDHAEQDDYYNKDNWSPRQEARRG